jgi:4-diphosphocytidyl-2-C-methyl-D-erythritol kinase
LHACAAAPAWYVVLDPRVAVSTREAFALFDLTHTKPDGTILSVSQGAAGNGHGAGNDLQAVVCARYPEVMRHLSWLKRFGDARMTGSGSCVFLACKDEASARHIFAQRPPDMVGFVAQGLVHHPLKDLC